MGVIIGTTISEMIEMDLFDMPGGQGTIVKALVQMDTQTGVKEGRKVGSKKDEVFWVKFHYEKLAQFCYYCGSLGHDENGCEVALADEAKGNMKTLE